MKTFSDDNSDRSYAMIGTGALGGFCGARLQKANLKVHFLLNRDYHHVRQHGLVVESPDGDFKLPNVQAYSSSQMSEMPRCDVVVIALKTTQNDWLQWRLPNLLKPDGVVLVLQNGLGMEADIARIVGSDRVMGGICFICSTKVAPGHIRHIEYDLITLADYAPDYRTVEISDRARQIGSEFERAGFLVSLTDDLLLARWQKLVCNIPFNGLTVVLNATTSEIMADSHARDLVEQIMQEVVSIADAQGCKIPPDYVQKRLHCIAKIKSFRTSMKMDYDARQPMEIEALIGNPLRVAQRAGIFVPQIAMLYQQLKFLDAYDRISALAG